MISGAFRLKKQQLCIISWQGREPLQDGKWQKMAFRHLIGIMIINHLIGIIGTIGIMPKLCYPLVNGYFWRFCITGGSKTLLLHPRGLGDEGNASWAQLQGSPRPQGPRGPRVVGEWVARKLWEV